MTNTTYFASELEAYNFGKELHLPEGYQFRIGNMGDKIVKSSQGEKIIIEQWFISIVHLRPDSDEFFDEFITCFDNRDGYQRMRRFWRLYEKSAESALM